MAGAQTINPYIPILQSFNQNEVEDQILAAAIGSEAIYVQKPMLVETIDNATATRIRRGLRKETAEHIVAQGETVGKIANDYQLNVATILEVNDIKPEDLNKIKPGTKLTIPPEKTTDSLAWLDKLNEEERKIREKQEQERLAKLVKSGKSRTVVASVRSGSVDNSGGTGQFIKPIGAGCANGYHWYAVDCPADYNTPIKAAAGGTVEVADASGWNGGYGKTIVINHGNGWSTRYAHLNSVNVSPGERVEPGELIAGSGNTGNSSGPHLHWEVIKNGQRLNPKSYGA